MLEKINRTTSRLLNFKEFRLTIVLKIIVEFRLT